MIGISPSVDIVLKEAERSQRRRCGGGQSRRISGEMDDGEEKMLSAREVGKE